MKRVILCVLVTAIEACGSKQPDRVKEIDVQCTNVCAGYWFNPRRGPPPSQCECHNERKAS